MERLPVTTAFVAVLAFLLVFPAASVAAEAEKETATAQEGDAVQFLRDMAQFFDKEGTFSVSVKMNLQMEAPSSKQEMAYEYAVRLDRPRRFAFILNEGPSGTSVYCNGENLTSYLPMEQRYKVAKVPESLADRDASGTTILLGMMVGGGGAHQTVHSGEGFADALMKDVKDAEYLGQVEYEGVTCHHIKVFEDEADWEVWVEVGDQPLPHRIIPDLSRRYADFGNRSSEMKVSLEIKFVDWNLSPEFTKKDFTFTPPEGAEQADSLFDVEDPG